MLRIISGKYRSRKLKEVKSDKTRPTTDKNKESLFNSLGQYFNLGQMLDLFSGSGSLGIEALSRGMGKVVFVEMGKDAYRIIKDNLSSLGIQSKSYELHKTDVFQYLQSTNSSFALIIADPPYALGRYGELMAIISSRQLLNDNGIIVMESDKSEILPEASGNIVKYKEKVLGNTKFTFYELGEQK